MEKDNQDEFSSDEKKPSSRASGPGLLVPIVIVLVVGGLWMLWATSPATENIKYSFFLEQLRAQNVAEVRLYTDRAIGRFKVPPELPVEQPAGEAAKAKTGDAKTGDGKTAEKETTTVPPRRAKEHFTVQLPGWSKDNSELSEALQASGASYDNAVQIDPTLMVSLLVTSVMIGLFVLFWFWLRRQQSQMMGGGFLSGFGRSPARRYEASRQAVTFKDVAGIEGVKADLMEIVEFLRNPKKFQRLGGRVPKGVLLNGSAGHRQDAAGPRGGRRGGRAVLFGQRIGIHSDVRGRRRQPRARSVPHGEGERPGDHLHRRD